MSTTYLVTHMHYMSRDPDYAVAHRHEGYTGVRAEHHTHTSVAPNGVIVESLGTLRVPSEGQLAGDCSSAPELNCLADRRILVAVAEALGYRLMTEFLDVELGPAPPLHFVHVVGPTHNTACCKIPQRLVTRVTTQWSDTTCSYPKGLGDLEEYRLTRPGAV